MHNTLVVQDFTDFDVHLLSIYFWGLGKSLLEGSSCPPPRDTLKASHKLEVRMVREAHLHMYHTEYISNIKAIGGNRRIILNGFLSIFLKRRDWRLSGIIWNSVRANCITLNTALNALQQRGRTLVPRTCLSLRAGFKDDTEPKLTDIKNASKSKTQIETSEKTSSTLKTSTVQKRTAQTN